MSSNGCSGCDDQWSNSDTLSEVQPGSAGSKTSPESDFISTPVLSYITNNLLENFGGDKYFKFVEAFSQELRHSNSTLKRQTLLPTCTPHVNSNSIGRYLVLDLGGSTLKIYVVDLKQQSSFDILVSRKWDMEDYSKVIDHEFFQLLADKIEQVVEEEKDDNGETFFTRDEPITMGISWSFPFEQTKSNNAFLSSIVGKGFKMMPDVENQDLAQILSQMLKKRARLNVSVKSVVNDSASAYVSGVYLHNCAIGLVLGTGLNASFAHNGAVLNSELSFFGSHFRELVNEVLDLTMKPEFKSKIDTHISSPDVFQPLEYMCSGRYIGELFRIGVERMVESGEVFWGQNCKKVLAYELTGEHVCSMYEQGYDKACEVVESLYHVRVSRSDFTRLQTLIDVIISRASVLLSACLSACCLLIRDEKRDEIVIGYIGSLFQHFHSYRDKVQQLLDENHSKLGLPPMKLVHVDHSAALGAAISAACYR